MNDNNAEFLGHIDEIGNYTAGGRTENSRHAIPEVSMGDIQLAVNIDNLPPPEKINIAKVKWNPDFI